MVVVLVLVVLGIGAPPVRLLSAAVVSY